MKVAIFDPFMGAGGDMIVASLLDISLSKKDLKRVVESLNLNLNFEIEDVIVEGLKAKRIRVEEVERVDRKLEEVLRILDSSDFDEKIKEDAKAIFRLIGEAESRVHGKSIDEIKFHEVGCDDAIFDVVSSVLGIRRLIERGYRFHSLEIKAGKGYVKCMHGVLPVPSPATLEILKGSDLPVVVSGEGELLTPTAAAILRYYCKKLIFSFSVRDVRYAAGSRGERPNLLRLILGETEHHDEVVILETNVDDASGEILGYAISKLQNTEGVLDVFAVAGIGKKARVSTLLRVVATAEMAEKVGKAIMELTGSLGVRIIPVHHRIIADRRTVKREIEIEGRKFEIRVKESEYNVKPEFEDIVRISEEVNLPLHEVYRRVMKVLEDDRSDGE